MKRLDKSRTELKDTPSIEEQSKCIQYMEEHKKFLEAHLKALEKLKEKITRMKH